MSVASFSDIEEEFERRVRKTVWCSVATVDSKGRTDDAVARQMEHVFLQFDANRDGGLDASEIMALMEDGGRPMSLRDAKGIVFEADQDGNGRIDTAEFAGLAQ